MTISIHLMNAVFLIGNGPRIAREIGSLLYFFPPKASNQMIRIYLSHIHPVSPPLLDIDIDAPPRLRIFFQLSLDLIAIRKWGLQTTGNVGLLHKFARWQMENPELNRGL